MDVPRGLLQCAQRDVAIEPGAFALLSLLVTHRDRVVTKEEIIDHVWEGRVVSAAVIATVIKNTRKVLGDDGAA